MTHRTSTFVLLAAAVAAAAVVSCTQSSTAPAPQAASPGTAGTRSKVSLPTAPSPVAPAAPAAKPFKGTVDVASLDMRNALVPANMPPIRAGGSTASLGGQTYEHALKVQAPTRIVIKLDGGATRFTATVGVDDDVKGMDGGTVQFTVTGDGQLLFPTPAAGRGRGAAGGGAPGGGRGRGGGNPPMRAGDTPQQIDLDVHGVHVLILEAGAYTDGNTNDHAVWANAKLEVDGPMPVVVPPPHDDPIVLTPPAPKTPRINSAKVFGVRPGHQILYTVAATGDRPMTFSADGLPAGVKLDAATGMLSGVSTERGAHKITFHASNALGKADMNFDLEVGDNINLVPQLGWNSWNCFGSSVTADKVKAATDTMVSKGLINHGWSYINIDDFWEKNGNQGRNNPAFAGPARDDNGVILPNTRFPDMKELADYIHSKGLKAGLYSSPGPTTCGGCTASYQHEEQDVMTWSKWGYDYIKYDWCSYGNGNIQTAEKARVAAEGRPPLSPRDTAIEPYRILGAAIKKADRDIVFSLCQYGNQNVWEWGASIGGNSWRTTGDISGNWRSVTSLMDQQVGHEKYAGPGHWNDPDMLVVGRTAIGSGNNPTQGLSANEMYTHYTAWVMLNSPLLIGCDMTTMDDFTTGLLTNDEVLAVNQDPLGQQARRVVPPTPSEGRAPAAGLYQVYEKDMSDGSKVVGLFSRMELDDTVTAKWSDLGITGKQMVRDVWRNKDIGVSDGEYSTAVPRHGVVLLKLTPVK